MNPMIFLDRIDDNPYQTRTTYDEAAIADLAADIAQRSLLQTPVGRLVDEAGQVLDPTSYTEPGALVEVFSGPQGQRVQLAFGHRRLRAFRLLVANKTKGGWGALPVELRRLSDEQMALYAWSENAQHKELTPIEEATAIQRMIDRFGWTQEQVAAKLGLSRPTITNKLRLLGAPQPVRDALANGTLSARQAGALLPLGEMPQELLDRAEATPDYNKSRRPSEIMKHAPDLSSDQIRERVQSMITETTTALGAEGNCPLDYVVDDPAVHAARCDACPIRVRKGQDMRCPDKPCLDRKTASWKKASLDAASAATGIQATTEDTTYSHIEDFAAGNKIHLQTILAQGGCPNLRLVFGGWNGQALQDFPHVSVLCLHGKGNVCKCLDRIKGVDREAAALAVKEAEQRVKDQLLAPTRQAVADALLGGQAPAGLWFLLLARVSRSPVSSFAKGSPKRIINEIARSLTDDVITWSHGKDLALAREDLDEFLAAAGLPRPWETPAAELILRKQRKILEWLKACAISIPTIEAVHGNMVNIRKLLDELDTAGISGEAFTDLSIHLHSTLDMLGSLTLLIEQRPENEQAPHLSWLTRYYFSDDNFNAASAWELSYGLEFAWVIDDQERDKRVTLMSARLAELTQVEATA